MAEKEERETSRETFRSGSKASDAPGGVGERIDMDSIVRELIRQWWVILLAAAAAALIAGTWLKFTYTPQYTTTATFVIGKSGVSSNTVSDSLSASSALADTFTTVVDSEILESRVCAELGVDSLDGEISVSVVESTSLMTMTVKASSPLLSYEMIQAVMDTAVDLCGEVAENVTIQVLQSPSIPLSASNPLKLRGPMLKTGAAAFAVMVFLFAMFAYFRNTVKSESDFRRKVDAKLLASIPHEKKYKTFSARVRKKQYSLFMENPTLSFGYVESCRMMGTRVRQELDKKGGHVLMVTSVSENEGKSTVAANLAMAMVQEGRGVVLVDCDFRKPAQYKILGLPEEKREEYDFGDALKTRGTVRLTTVGMEKNLPVVFSTISHKRLLNRDTLDALEATVAALKKSVDYIILDTSPMGLVAESTQIASVSDASLLVVKQDMVDARFLNDAVDQLGDGGAEVLGCVFNDVRTGFFAKAGTYGNYYGSGRYGYGRYGYGRYGYGHYDKTGRQGNKKESSGSKEDKMQNSGFREDTLEKPGRRDS